MGRDNEVLSMVGSCAWHPVEKTGDYFCQAALEVPSCCAVDPALGFSGQGVDEEAGEFGMVAG